jgi:lysophospholipase L1-like esterase
MCYGAIKSATFDERVKSFIDMVTNGYFLTNPGYIFTVSDSWGHGYGARDPRGAAWPYRLSDRMKALSRDGGSYYPSSESFPVWDISTTTLMGQKAFNGMGWWYIRPYFPQNYINGINFDAWLSDGGLGGIWERQLADPLTYIAGQQIWTANASHRFYILPSNVASVPKRLRVLYKFVSAQSGSSEPAGFGTAGIGELVTDGDCVWACVTYSAAYATRANSTVYTNSANVSNAAGDHSFRLVGGATGATEPTWPSGIDTVVTETGKTTKWQNYGWVHLQVPLPPAVSYDIIYGKHAQVSSADNIERVGFAEDEIGYPVTLNATAATTSFGNTLRLAPQGDKLVSRTILFEHVSGEFWPEGILTHRYPDGSGIHDINVSIAGLGLDKVMDHLDGNATAQMEYVGANFVPHDAPVLLCLEIGKNERGRGVDIATEMSYITKIIGYFKAVYTDLTILWLQPPPISGAGVPLPGDSAYDYVTAERVQAESLGAAGLDLSQVFGGGSADAAYNAGLYIEDKIHPTDKGHTLIAEAVLEAFELPDTAGAQSLLLDGDREYLDAKFAALAASGPDSTKVDQIHKATFGKKIKRGGAVPTSMEILDAEDLTTRVVKWDITGAGTSAETWEPE